MYEQIIWELYLNMANKILSSTIYTFKQKQLYSSSGWHIGTSRKLTPKSTDHSQNHGVKLYLAGRKKNKLSSIGIKLSYRPGAEVEQKTKQNCDGECKGQ